MGRPISNRKCEVEGCEEKHRGKGLCKKHWFRMYRASTIDLQTKSLWERFHEKYVPVTETGCWIWTRSKCRGYGRISYNGTGKMAHRISWEIHCGPIPEGMLVLHKCDVPACVNPEHLFLGTYKDNTQDAIKKGRLHIFTKEDCKKGNLSRWRAQTLNNEGGKDETH